jgi:hypothetical protein
MAQPAIQTSFASGEWAPRLRSRVDIQKYRAGAALLRNFYVDYAGGGASTRPGTRFCNQCKISNQPVRIISFQPTSNLAYVLEFGNGYIRFFQNGAPILEPPVTITGISGNLVTATNTYAAGDWVFIGNAYYIVTAATGANFNVSDLYGNTSVTPSGATAQRVYTLTSPYAAADLFPNPITGNPGLKFSQNVTSIIITHPSYPVQVLTIITAANWTITAASFGSTIGTPTGLVLTTSLSNSPPNNWSYGYTVTAVDINGQESTPPAVSTLLNYKSLSDATVGGTNTLTWTAVTGAQSYNVYKASPIYSTTFPTNIPVGFIGNTVGTSFTDTTPGIAPDFAQTPPIGQNPFQGAGVKSYAVTASGAPLTTVPSVTIPAPPAGGYQATAGAQLGVTSIAIVGGGFGFVLGNTYNVEKAGTVYCTIKVTGISGTTITAATIAWTGSITGAGNTTPSNPLAIDSPLGGGSNGSLNATWGVVAINGIQPGAGYLAAPVPVFSPPGPTATSTLGDLSSGNPGVSSFIQQRLCLAAQKKAVQSINMSQPASYFNFNVSFPIEADDAISTNIVSTELNDIRSLTQVPTGLLALTGKAGWLINGGAGISTTDPITPANITAQPQAYSGANDVAPLKINMDVLFVTNKGNYVRDLVYNIWTQLFQSSDISVLSTHLFFGFFITQWAWSEEPFKTVWAVRNDGVLLSLAYVKEQELTGWAHHDTNGTFQSVASCIELVNGNTVDAVYVVVQRFINGQTLQYVERLADRYFTYGREDSWFVDCALQTQPQFFTVSPLTVTGNASATGNAVTLSDTVNSPFTGGMVGWVVRMGGGIYTITVFTSSSQVTATVARVGALDSYTNTALNTDDKGYTIWQPVTSIGGLNQLVGQTVTGVADGAVVPSTVVSAPGNVTLSTSASKVTLGLAYTPQLQTLPLDLGEPTVQSKRKKVNAATMRVADTLGLQIGTTFANVVNMKDYQLNAIPSVSNGVTLVTDLYSGDGRQILDQVWQEIGQLCVQQNLPYPATVLGVMPEVVVGDTPEGGGGRRR